MVLYRKRERFAGFSVKVGTFFSKFGLSPNQWTILIIIPALAAFYYIISRQFIIAAVFLLVSAFLDLVDGSVARVMGKVSKLGAYLDTIMDRYVEGVIIVGLLLAGLPAVYGIPAYVWIFLFFFGSLMTTYVKSAAKEKELTEKEIKGGLLERAERLILLFLGILLAGLFGAYFLTWTIAILAVLTNLTALQRVWIALKK